MEGLDSRTVAAEMEVIRDIDDILTGECRRRLSLGSCGSHWVCSKGQWIVCLEMATVIKQGARGIRNGPCEFKCRGEVDELSSTQVLLGYGKNTGIGRYSTKSDYSNLLFDHTDIYSHASIGLACE